ncbi:MAG: DHHW family protein [Oscillospiraceae bacterium]
MGFISAIDRDKTISEEENRALRQKPEFSFSALMSGELMRNFDEYYSDTFPKRSGFMKISKKITALFSQNAAGKDDIVIINRDGDDGDFGGEAILEDKDWMKTTE